MELVVTRRELAQALRPLRAQGLRVGLVPTMGALHEGHLSLIRAARERADVVVVSIFVNPLQFGPSEDLARYPRTLEADLAGCSAAGADFVFAPPPAEVYPPGFQTRVCPGAVAEPLCGARRPGHFEGVATVVTKLFGMVGPDLAVFGQKDYQQLLVIRRVVADLDLPVEIFGAPIVREADGLALSSRNVYLSPAERRAALALPRSLESVVAACAAGERSVAALEGLGQRLLQAAPELQLDYLELRDAQDLSPMTSLDRDGLLAAAVFVGRTRLIDNRILRPGHGG